MTLKVVSISLLMKDLLLINSTLRVGVSDCQSQTLLRDRVWTPNRARPETHYLSISISFLRTLRPAVRRTLSITHMPA